MSRATRRASWQGAAIAFGGGASLCIWIATLLRSSPVGARPISCAMAGAIFPAPVLLAALLFPKGDMPDQPSPMTGPAPP